MSSRHESPEVFQVGSDSITIEDDRLIILALHEMSEWAIREFCRPPIFFQGRKYYLSAKSAATSPYRFRYELKPWPSNLHEESNLSFTYDAEYVAERDVAWRREQRASRGHSLLALIYPLLGFSWSGFKERVLVHYGFDAISITSWSLMIELGLFMAQGILVGYVATGFGRLLFGDHLIPFIFDYLVAVALLFDSAVRYSQILRGEDSYPYGFLEWLCHRPKANQRRP